MSDWCAAYGWPASRPLTYSDYFALYLNIPRQKERRALEIDRGLRLSRTSRISAYTADAMVDDPEERDDLRFDINSRR